MPFIEGKPLVLDMKCCCGASLYCECFPGVSWEFTQLVGLATAWTSAHKVHHVEPAKPTGGT